MKKMKIVFMGTPDFAVTILEGLLSKEFNVVGVITAPDRPAGRGRKISESSVKTFAQEKNLNILQPTNLKDEFFINELKSLNADLFVVVAFRMLPEVVWTLPPMGTINLHASLLPNYRGAAPINWALINGEKETGVTTFFIEKEIDTGKIIQSKKVSIHKNMNAGQLHEELANVGAKVMIETVTAIFSGNVNPIDQNELFSVESKNAPKIFKQDCKINWDQPAKNVHDFIRGLNPYPGAWSRVVFKNKELSCKFFNSNITNIKVTESLNEDDQLNFHFPCKDYFISIEEIQIEGKKRLKLSEFSKGNLLDDLKI